jgi:hypothetical protein
VKLRPADKNGFAHFVMRQAALKVCPDRVRRQVNFLFTFRQPDKVESGVLLHWYE